MSKVLLINGCSYAYNWKPTQWFEDYNIVNIADGEKELQYLPVARHYDKSDYYILENYLNDYRKY